MTPEQFLAKYVSIADQVQLETGIPAEMALTQAAIESAWGKKAPGNNFFGIKADPKWTGQTVAFTTQEEIAGKKVTVRNERFRAYPTPTDSFRDYARFLATNPRYSQAVTLARSGDVPRALAAVAAAGYATDSGYPKLLSSVLQSVRRRIDAARKSSLGLRTLSTLLILSGTVGAFFLR